MTPSTERIARLRQQVEALRELARKRQAGGATGLQIASAISQQNDRMVVALMEEALSMLPADQQRELERRAAIIAVGGTGRGDCAPCSDVDLLFLSDDPPPATFAGCVSQVVRDCWDAGLKLGHSVRTLRDTLRMARQDTEFATSLIETRLLWGQPNLLADLRRRFQRQVIAWRRTTFSEACRKSRELERAQHGEAVLQLEPDLKRSFGGLRDLHLLRWIGYVWYGVADIDGLKLRGALSQEDARRLVLAFDYLMSVRINLHLHAGKPHDLLTRDDQLRIAEERHIPGTAGQRPVERFMQEFFQQSLTIAEISSRFVARHERHPLHQRLRDFVLTFRADDVYLIGPDALRVIRRHRATVVHSLEAQLRLFLIAQRHGVTPETELLDAIKEHATKSPPPASLTPGAQRTFLELLRRAGSVTPTLRLLFETGVLDHVLPAMAHTRCLLQFNQYHSYTVDEHTFRAVAAAEAFETDPGPVGRSYRELRHKELLHLALLLHDAGKGFEEDHSEVGKCLAEEAGTRLGLPDHQRDLVIFLVHRHLLMATLAFRRDISDPEILLNFSHQVGSPDRLQMLYVLTAADITAVGPGVWNDWKAELLASFRDRSMVWLSGTNPEFEEERRIDQLADEVGRQLKGVTIEPDELRDRLRLAPSHYLLATRPERIARDIEIIARRAPDDISIEGLYDPETRTIEYRVITSESIGVGFFHKLTGVLSAKRMEILSAQICTYGDGLIVDGFRVRDYDHDGPIPDFRRDEVAGLMCKALRGEIDVETLFRSRLRFAPNIVQGPVSNLPMQVLIDNETSDRCTVIDIFAHDRPGLLYRIARSLFELDLSVDLAKISTHFDQVVDVFYVTDAKGRKIADGHRLRTIRDVLAQQIEQFESSTNEPASALG